MNYDYLVVGAGFAGAVLAERLASQAGKSCLVIDRRSHIGGNAYDAPDSAGILLHKYGPHYFRTNSQIVVNYLSQFTEWYPVDYQVLSSARGQLWNFPINLNTFEQFIGRPSSSEEMQRTLAAWRIDIPNPRNSEEVIISQVGRELYELFFEKYTLKQWKRHPRELDASVCGRIPIRFNRDNRYVTETFQALPREGYTAMFRRMLAHPLITVALETDYRHMPSSVAYDRLIYTGMIDEFFEYRHGPLPYRSLRFEEETLPQEFYQPAMQVNYPNDFEFTRIVEIKHATGQKSPHTTIIREYPQDYGEGLEAYYPIPAPDSKAIYQKYLELSLRHPEVCFVGRLAQYRYYNMDQVTAMALAAFQKIRASDG
jgi:UDP-galactopyranose mutase